MPISQTNQLFNLVKSLTKAEKRNFRIYSSRIQDGESMKYIQLFDILDKQKLLDESLIFKKFPKVQLSNLKRHLYSQILISLQLIHKRRNVNIKIREYMDFAEILYGKGLYLQSLKIVAKAKTLAEKNLDDLSYLYVLEFEKKIESRHITRTGPSKTKLKLDLASEKLSSITNTIKLTNLKIYLHGLYIKNGHVKSDAEKEKISQIFEDNIRSIPLATLNVKEKIHLYQSFVWYYYILIDFIKCYSYALKWVILIKENPKESEKDHNLLLRGYHYLLTSAYNNLDLENYNFYNAELEAYRKDNYKKFDSNTQIISFLYAHHGRFNKYFLSGEFREGLEIIPRTLRRIKRYEDKMDPHQIMVFYFKIAWMYLGAENPSQALKYLNRIMTMEVGILRSDIQSYTRLMHIMAHYDLKNFDILNYLVKNTISFFNKLRETNSVQDRSLQFFNEIVKLPVSEREPLFIKLSGELLRLQHNPYEAKAFLYLDILSWVNSKIERKPMSEMIKEKIKNYGI